MMMNQRSYKDIREAVLHHPLFKGMEQSTALSLAGDCELKRFNRNESMFKPGERRPGLMLILEGSAEVVAGGKEVLETVQAGEIIGLSSMAPFLRSEAEQTQRETVGARAVEDTSVMLIPFSVMKKTWTSQGVRDYLFAEVASRLEDVYASFTEQLRLADELDTGEPIILRVQDVMKPALVAEAVSLTIQEAAIRMSAHESSALLLMEGGRLEGIITERDIVRRAVAAGVGAGSPAKDIMTVEPVSISRSAYFYEAVSAMLLHGIKHLPVADGAKVHGMVTFEDLFGRRHGTVLRTVRKLETATEAELPAAREAIYALTGTLLQEGVPVDKLLEMVTGLYDKLTGRIVELATLKIGVDGGRFAFFLMGSAGRGEQFMVTDQDHFLVYQDGADPAHFRALGEEITRLLEAAGYARCDGLMMASEEKWRGSVTQWEDRLRSWMVSSTNENLLLAQNFFSYRMAAGDPQLEKELEKRMEGLLDRSKIFLYRMAKEELKRPVYVPDKSFMGFLKPGKKKIDLKKHALFPYHHGLQILCLVNGELGGTPAERISALERKKVITREFAADLRAAASNVLGLYVRQRWAGKGTELLLGTLSTREKEELAISLRAFKELQEKVQSYFPV